MTDTINLPDFGYRYIPGPFQYSAGIAALAGFHLERITFLNAIPLDDGFRQIEAYLDDARLPRTAFCACELRSPAPFTDDGFRAFNQLYVGTLERWGIVKGQVNPVARSNVCPVVNPPSTPSFHAFTVAVPKDGPGSFVVAGSAESIEGAGPYKDHTVSYGDTSPTGMRAKARHVLGAMESRMAALGFGWADATSVQVYTVHDLHPFLGDEIAGRGAARLGLTWHFDRPPVVDLEYEMDCRAVFIERVLAR